jgi:hypothetical protein
MRGWGWISTVLEGVGGELGKKLGWFVFVKGSGGCGSPKGHSGGWGAGGSATG